MIKRQPLIWLRVLIPGTRTFLPEREHKERPVVGDLFNQRIADRTRRLERLQAACRKRALQWNPSRQLTCLFEHDETSTRNHSGGQSIETSTEPCSLLKRRLRLRIRRPFECPPTDA